MVNHCWDDKMPGAIRLINTWDKADGPDKSIYSLYFRQSEFGENSFFRLDTLKIGFDHINNKDLICFWDYTADNPPLMGTAIRIGRVLYVYGIHTKELLVVPTYPGMCLFIIQSGSK